MKKIIPNLIYILLLSTVACKKSVKDDVPPPSTDTAVVIQPAIDPPLAGTIGFFLNDWQPKTFSTPSFTEAAIPAVATYTITVNPSAIVTKIPRSIAGNNANLWMSQIVTESSLMNHVTNLHPHIIRFPGGSISDVFFWNKEKNAPPVDAPEFLVKADGTKEKSSFWYGKNSESWTLSVDNYYRMLQQTGNEGMITVNYGYARYGTGTNPVAAAAHLAADWVRYDNGRTKYWEIGNENFGDWEAGYRIDPLTNKDGQPEIINGEVYGQHFNVFVDSMRKAAQEIGKTIYIGALLVESPPQSWNTITVKTWNAGLLGKAGSKPDFFIVHNYYTPYQQNSTASEVLNSASVETQKMTEYVKQSLQAAGVGEKPLALTEWNIFAQGSMQAVSHINGMHGVMVVGEALKNKYGMTARWNLANAWENGNDHGMFNNGDEPDAVKWNPRPAFYHLYFFQKMLGDRFITSSIPANSNLESYASSFSSGQVGVALMNKTTTAQNVQVEVQNFRTGDRFYWYTLSGGNDNGSFSRKVIVNGNGPSGVSGGPLNYTDIKAYSATTKNGIKVTVPALSAVYLVVDKK
ncbi:MAG: alpha-L-arabinofuranosidase [Flavisolibacter sp.]|nr:alpha-L-arabinofuranosidase [Flavisolibacter sp.]